MNPLNLIPDRIWHRERNKNDAYLEDINPVIAKVNDIIAVINVANTYQGVIDCSTNPNYPAATEGQYWRVSVAGKIGGGSGVAVEAGDEILCIATNAGGTEVQVGASFMLIQKNMIPCSVADLYTGTNDSDFITAKTLADANLGFSAATILSMSGGTTSQLDIGASIAELGMVITAVASTDSASALQITQDINNATVSTIMVGTSISTALGAGEIVSGASFNITNNSADADTSIMNGIFVQMLNTTTSRADMIAFSANHIGTVTATGGIINYIGLNVVPTFTSNTGGGVLNYYGVNVDLSGCTLTAGSNDVYGIRVATGGVAGVDAAGFFTGNGGSVWLVDGSYALYTRGSIMLDGAGVVANHLISTTAIALTTGSLISYLNIQTKTSGYLFNGSMTTSTLDNSTIVDDFTQACAHDGVGSDTLMGKRFVWSGNVPNGTLASSLSITDLEFSGIFGSGANKGGDLCGLDINMQGTINDASALEYGLKVSISTTRTGAASVFGAYVLTNSTVTAAAYLTNTTTALHLCTGSNAMELSGTITTALSFLDVANVTNIMSFNAIAGAVIANALVPAIAPDGTTVGADACLKVDVNGTPYYIPLYDTLHA
jgi:hypothetical protein